jgi:hypothetical protein
MADFSPDSPPSRGAGHPRAWLFGALSLVLLRAIPNLRFPLGRDQATYALIGQGLLHGQQIYRDLWDNKPPGIFYIFAMVVKLFGPVMWSVGVVDILWLMAISYCIFRFARRYLGPPAAAIAVLCNAAWHCTQGYIHAAQPETFLMLLVFVSYFLLLPEERWSKARLLGAGLALGAAFWLKYNAVVFFPFLLLLPHLDVRGLDREPRRIRLTVSLHDWFVRSLIVVAGAAAVVALVLGYFYLAGVWPAFKEVQFEVLPRYGAMAFERTPRYWLVAVFQTYNHLGPWNEGIVAAALLIAWKGGELASVTPALLMALAGYATTAIQGRFHPYYFETCFPFVAMLWGYGVVKTYQGLGKARAVLARRGWRLASWLTWLVLANLAYALLLQDAFRVVEQYRSLDQWRRDADLSYAEYLWQIPLEKLHDQLAVVDFLKEHSASSDQVYVWGTAPLINFLAQRASPSRFVSNLALISPWGPARWRDELAGELERKLPRFIVVARHDAITGVSYTRRDSEECLETFPALAAFLHNRYEPVENLRDFEIYRLK